MRRRYPTLEEVLDDMGIHTLRQGREEEKEKIARNLLALGMMNVEEIAHATELSVEQVHSLNNKE